MKNTICAFIMILLLLFFGFIHYLEAKTVEQYMKEAKIYFNRGQEEIADKLMAEALEEYPTDRYLLRYKGKKLLSKGKYEESHKVFQEAIRYNPDYAEGYLYLGYIEKEKVQELWFTGKKKVDLNDLKLAEEYWKKAIELDPKSPAHADLGGLYFDQGKYEDAINEINIALKYNEPSEGVYLVLGDAHTALGKYKEALEAYKNAQKIGDPTFYETLLSIAKTYENLGEWKAARKIYSNALELHKNDKDLLEGLVRVEQKIKELGPEPELKGPTLDYKGYKDK